MKKNRITAFSTFSGIGGFCEGFRLSGVDVVGAIEFDRYAAENYKLNFPKTPLYTEDIHGFLPSRSKNKFNEHWRDYVGEEVDILFGGPPCQGYSQIGPRNLDDPRNDLYRQFTRLARSIRPTVLVIENVPNMFMMSSGYFRDQIFSELRRSGYDNIGWVKLNAARHGVPQERHRIFVLAIASGMSTLSAQEVLDGASFALEKTIVSVGDAIGDLPQIPVPQSGHALPYPKAKSLTNYQREMRLDSDGDLYSQQKKLSQYFKAEQEVLLHNHHTKEIQAKRLNLIKLLKPGLKADSLPKHVWDNARPEKWRRLDSARPSHTILAQMHRDLSEWVHPAYHRWITVREALRLQSFHDGFVLRTSEWQQLKQIGNAVPPLLGYVPAMAAKYVIAKRRGLRLPFELKGQGQLF